VHQYLTIPNFAQMRNRAMTRIISSGKPYWYAYENIIYERQALRAQQTVIQAMSGGE
jgi:hypothetical protein